MADPEKPDVAPNQRELQPRSPQTPEPVTGTTENEHSPSSGSGVRCLNFPWQLAT